MPVLMLLLMGVLGVSVLVLEALFWKPMVDSGLIELIGPGTIPAKMSVALIGIGLLGILGFILEVMAKRCRYAKYKLLSLISYFGLLWWASVLYRGV
jgi:hypothetical protein